MPWDTMRVIVGERRSGKTTLIVDTYRRMLHNAYDLQEPYGFLHLTDTRAMSRSLEEELRSVKRDFDRAMPPAPVYGKEYLCTWWDVRNSPKRSLLRPDDYFNHCVIEEPIYSTLTLEQMLETILPLQIQCLTIVGGDRPGITPMKQALMLMTAS